MAEQKVLLTARNGMKVWVPISKVQQFKEAQKKQPNADEMQALKSGVRSLLESMIAQAQSR
jgi:hypothetical protein